MLNNALIFLLQALLSFLTVAFLLRFYFQLTKTSFQNQAGQVIMTLTNFAVKPMRRIIPSIGKFDIATLLLALITQLFLAIVTQALRHSPLIMGNQFWLVMFVVALIGIASLSITILMYAVLLQVILSWVHPHSPVTPILNKLTNPVLRHFKKWIPLVGNVDFSPLAFMLLAQLLLTQVLLPLENNLRATLLHHLN